MDATTENIKKHGWESLYVFDESEKRPSFLYSIGLEESFDHPEIVIFGLPRKTMHGLLSDVVEDIKEGVVFECDKRVSGLLS